MSFVRRRIVGVMGSGQDRYEEIARPVGMTIARLGYHLLTGGGGGVMAAVSEFFVGVEDRAGLCLGVTKARKFRIDEESGERVFAPSPPNDWVEVPIVTHLPLSGTRGTDPLSRNHINVLTADVVVALPGGAGTRSEIGLAAQYGRPLVLYLGGETVDGHSAEEILHDIDGGVTVVATPADFEARLRELLA